MKRTLAHDAGSYIDPKIENPFERSIAWAIALYISADQIDEAIKAKWRMARYLQGGY